MSRTSWSVWCFLLVLVVAVPAFTQEEEQAQIDFANGLFQRGFYDESVDEYGSYLKEFPGGAHEAVARYRMGEAFAATKRYKEAVASLDELLTKFPSSTYLSRARLRKGVSLFWLKRFDEAVQDLGAVSKGDTEEMVRGEALYYLGKSYGEQKKTSEALEAYGRLIEEAPSSAFVAYGRYQQAYVWVSSGELEKAATAFAAIQEDPGANRALKVESMYRSAEAYDKLGWHDAAIGAYQSLKNTYPDTAYAEKANYAYAWALYKGGKIDEALKACADFITASPESKQVPGMIYLVGNCYQQQKKYDKAIAEYRKVRKAAEGTSLALRAHYKECWALHWNGSRDDALAQSEAFVAQGGKSPLVGDIHFLLGTVKFDMGNAADAKGHFVAVVSSYPESEFAPESLYKSGECAIQMTQLDEGAGYFEKFADENAGHELRPEALYRAGEARLRLGAYPAAVNLFSAVLSDGGLPGRDAEVKYGLAAARHNQGLYSESIKDFERLLAEHPDSSFAQEARFRIGDYLLREAKKPVEAVDYFKALLESSPTGIYAERALEGIALSRFEAKDYDGAAQMFHRLVTEFSGETLSGDMLTWVGQHLFDREEWNQAADVFDFLVLKHPELPNPERVLIKTAEARAHAKRNDEALKAYQAVIDTAPFSSLALDAKYEMALMYDAAGERQRSVDLLEETASANSGDTAARARYRLGEMSEERKAYGEAARHYLRVAILFLHPELSPESLWRAGQCFEREKDTGQAKKTYQEIVVDYPESSQADLARERLRAIAAS